MFFCVKTLHLLVCSMGCSHSGHLLSSWFAVPYWIRILVFTHTKKTLQISGCVKSYLETSWFNCLLKGRSPERSACRQSRASSHHPFSYCSCAVEASYERQTPTTWASEAKLRGRYRRKPQGEFVPALLCFQRRVSNAPLDTIKPRTLELQKFSLLIHLWQNVEKGKKETRAWFIALPWSWIEHNEDLWRVEK